MKVWITKNGYSISRVLSLRSNSFLLSYNGKNILIDTGPGREWRQLKKRLKDLNIKKIDFLILTHTHYDHAENSEKLKREYGAKVIVHKTEASFLENGESTIPKGTNFLTHYLVNILTPTLTVKFRYEQCKPDILVDQYLDMKDLGFDGYILHTPGHSAGSQSIIVDGEIAMVGDAMLGKFPGLIFPPFADNEDVMIESWGKLLQTKCRLFLPSHGTANSRELLEKEFRKRCK